MSMPGGTYRPRLQKPRAAYVHVPFCRHRCGYCNFALVADRDYLIDRFLDALEVELSWLEQRYTLETLFLGGGTPTHLDLKQLDRLFEMLDRWFEFGTAEVSTEANPSDLVPEKIHHLIGLGVNRFSLGVQSFHENKLKFLERDHRAEQVVRVVEAIQNRTANVSLDMIFATAGESLEMWLDDLRQVGEVAPAHLSTYELTLEKGTQFWNRHRSGSLAAVSEELRSAMYVATQEFMQQRGYQQYEISSFALPGFRCMHNQVYWNGQPYFAFGAGASRYIDRIRETNHGSVSTYIKRVEQGLSPVSLSEELGAEDRARELLVVGLRMLDGVPQKSFEDRTGFTCTQLLESPKCQELIERDMIDFRSEHVKLTPEGILLYDSIAEVVLRGAS